jgi:hypothetical protein
MTDKQRRRGARGAQVVRRRDEVGHVRGEVGVGELALARP